MTQDQIPGPGLAPQDLNRAAELDRQLADLAAEFGKGDIPPHLRVLADRLQALVDARAALAVRDNDTAVQQQDQAPLA